MKPFHVQVLKEAHGFVPGTMVGGPAVAVGLLRAHYLFYWLPCTFLMCSDAIIGHSDSSPKAGFLVFLG